MKALIVTCAHAYMRDDGEYFTPSVHSYEFFKRYLKVFDEIEVVARVRKGTEQETKDMPIMSGAGLSVCALPYFRGMKQMAAKLPGIITAMVKGKKRSDCIIYRVPQMESYLAWIFGGSRKKPFAVEVVADPQGWTHVKGIAKRINIFLLKRMCARANGAAYVTAEYLQSLYPPKAHIKGESKKAFTTNYSSIQLDRKDILSPKTYNPKPSIFSIVHVSNAIDDDLKGHTTVIEAASMLKKAGHNINVKFIGDGSAINQFKSYAEQMSVADEVEFVGRISGKERLMKTMSDCDIMVFPSRSEGLPRSVIEAMAVGLPVLSTPIAGIPELVSKEYLRHPDDAKGFTEILLRLFDNLEELREMSANNVKTAEKYTSAVLEDRRDKFYSMLKDIAK
ncbi:MAG: glycosyltransferase family 4 protein [Eubacteriales bacterium]